MKKVTFYLMMMVLSLSVVPTQMLAAEKNPTAIANTPKEVPAEVKVLLNRLDEIKAMDKSSLNSVEKKELRKEVRAIKTELRSTGNGVYLSVGAVIIVILLLILLL
ncbi:hypothetical protein SAMN05444395_10618 [Flavobacterium fryxellicola]|uniref:Seryl-tRNA synthetase n=1 Tax=Flavobacterium fryxellicola TaxID=249352 RepID=A0A167YH68_9FLAO|nr:hypothetical protein [Flavobacterium fryxellicola]OAB29409.1 hypothetical protein FBFR_03790 [Flavobacterium fryxellicola]SHN70761.1 hypothetical protein SAMN05444395_10618 [Flavobacterium fryxellicola]